MGKGSAPSRLRDGQALGVSLPNWIGGASSSLPAVDHRPSAA
jgi:hypothetical protein